MTRTLRFTDEIITFLLTSGIDMKKKTRLKLIELVLIDIHILEYFVYSNLLTRNDILLTVWGWGYSSRD